MNLTFQFKKNERDTCTFKSLILSHCYFEIVCKLTLLPLQQQYLNSFLACNNSYGENCQYPCDPFCVNQTCDRLDGTCQHACPDSSKSCGVGMWYIFLSGIKKSFSNKENSSKIGKFTNEYLMHFVENLYDLNACKYQQQNQKDQTKNPVSYLLPQVEYLVHVCYQ